MHPSKIRFCLRRATWLPPVPEGLSSESPCSMAIILDTWRLQSGSKAMKQTKQAAELLNMAEESKKGTAAKAVNRVSAQRSKETNRTWKDYGWRDKIKNIICDVCCISAPRMVDKGNGASERKFFHHFPTCSSGIPSSSLSSCWMRPPEVLSKSIASVSTEVSAAPPSPEANGW